MKGLTVLETDELNELRKDIATLKDIFLNVTKELKNNDPLMTTVELMDYLKKGSTWVDANKHKIGCSKIGGEWRFRKSVVDAYINNTYHKDN